MPVTLGSRLFPYTTLFRSTNLLKFMRASIKMIGVSNLQSFIASMTQNLTLSDISDEPLFRSGSAGMPRSEERFSRNAETDLVCRLLLEKKNKRPITAHSPTIRRKGEEYY